MDSAQIIFGQYMCRLFKELFRLCVVVHWPLPMPLPMPFLAFVFAVQTITNADHNSDEIGEGCEEYLVFMNSFTEVNNRVRKHVVQRMWPSRSMCVHFSSIWYSSHADSQWCNLTKVVHACPNEAYSTCTEW